MFSALFQGSKQRKKNVLPKSHSRAHFSRRVGNTTSVISICISRVIGKFPRDWRWFGGGEMWWSAVCCCFRCRERLKSFSKELTKVIPLDKECSMKKNARFSAVLRKSSQFNRWLLLEVYSSALEPNGVFSKCSKLWWARSLSNFCSAQDSINFDNKFPMFSIHPPAQKLNILAMLEI